MIKKLAIVLMLSCLSFSSGQAAETCEGETDRTVNINQEFSFCWTKNPTHDMVKSYTVYRNGEVYDTVLDGACGTGDFCETPKYKSNVEGDFTFTVTATDTYDYQSDHSDAVTLSVAKLPPSKPGGCSIRVF